MPLLRSRTFRLKRPLVDKKQGADTKKQTPDASKDFTPRYLGPRDVRSVVVPICVSDNNALLVLSPDCRKKRHHLIASDIPDVTAVNSTPLPKPQSPPNGRTTPSTKNAYTSPKTRKRNKRTDGSACGAISHLNDVQVGNDFRKQFLQQQQQRMNAYEPWVSSAAAHCTPHVTAKELRMHPAFKNTLQNSRCAKFTPTNFSSTTTTR